MNFSELVLWAALGRTAGPALPIEWHGPPGCGSARALRDRVEALTQGPLDVGRLSRVHARIDPPRRGVWRVSLVLETTNGDRSRSVEGPDCDSVLEGAAFIVAVAHDSPPEPDPPSPRPSTPPPEKPPTSPRSPPPKLWGSVATGGGLRVGAWPFGGTVALALALEGPHFRVELLGAYDGPVEVPAPMDPAVAVRVQVGRVQLRGCGVQRWGGVELPYCALIETGAIDARGLGTGLATSRRRYRPWVAPGLAAGIAGRVDPRWSLGLDLEGVVPVLRHTFVAGPDPALAVVHIGAAEIRALASIRIRFP